MSALGGLRYRMAKSAPSVGLIPPCPLSAQSRPCWCGWPPNASGVVNWGTERRAHDSANMAPLPSQGQAQGPPCVSHRQSASRWTGSRQITGAVDLGRSPGVPWLPWAGWPTAAIHRLDWQCSFNLHRTPGLVYCSLHHRPPLWLCVISRPLRAPCLCARPNLFNNGLLRLYSLSSFLPSSAKQASSASQAI